MTCHTLPLSEHIRFENVRVEHEHELRTHSFINSWIVHINNKVQNHCESVVSHLLSTVQGSVMFHCLNYRMFRILNSIVLKISLEIGFRNEKLFVKPQKGILLDHVKESSQVPSPFQVSWCVNIKCHQDYPCVSSCDT